MKKAVTLIELLFVIVLLAVLSAAAIMALPKNRAISDAKFIAALITQKRFDAQGNQAQNECIRVDNALSDNKYTIRSELNPAVTTLCFDWMGRVYDENNVTIPNIVDINITSQNKNVSILVFPVTGYVKINN